MKCFAWVFAALLTPLSANAVTFVENPLDLPTVDPTSVDGAPGAGSPTPIEGFQSFLWEVYSEAEGSGPGSYGFTFVNTVDLPVDLFGSYTILPVVPGSSPISGLEVYWSSDSLGLAPLGPIVSTRIGDVIPPFPLRIGVGESVTVFARWDSFDPNTNLDFRVDAAPIPLPAAGWLLLGGLGALGVLKRRAAAA